MVVLMYRGLSTLRKANDILVQAVITDLVKSARLEKMIADNDSSTGAQAAPGYQ